jgi:hypothetical protein
VILPFKNTNNSIQAWVRFPDEGQEDKERSGVIDR